MGAQRQSACRGRRSNSQVQKTLWAGFLVPKTLAGGDYGEAFAVGSCSKDPSTNRGPDFAESGPNGPKRTRERLKTVSPKNSKNDGTGGLSAPKTLRKGSTARPSPLSKRSPRETTGEEEEEACTAGGSSTPGGRRRRCVLHTCPRHAPTPPEARRRSHLQNPPRKR